MKASFAPWPVDASLREEWGELYENSVTATPFQSLEWVESWWSVFGFSKQARLLQIRSGKNLVGLYPLYRTFAPWRALRVMGTGVSDYLSPLMRTGMEKDVAGAVREFLMEMAGVDLMDLQQLRLSGAFCEAMQVQSSPQDAVCPVLDLPQTFADYTATLSKSLRYDVSRGLRSPCSVEVADSPEMALRHLEIFLDLHTARWRKRGLPGAFGMPGVKKFHRAFVVSAAKSGVLRLMVAYGEDKSPIGALYAMRGGDATFFYQSGFAPEAKAQSPGTLLIATAISHAIEDGNRVFDFLRGDEPYKLRWKPQRLERNGRWLESLGPVRGRIGQMVNQVEARVEARIRARLEGKGLLK